MTSLIRDVLFPSAAAFGLLTAAFVVDTAVADETDVPLAAVTVAAAPASTVMVAAAPVLADTRAVNTVNAAPASEGQEGRRVAGIAKLPG